MWWRSDDSESHTERTLPTIVPLLLVTALIAAAWALFFAARENCSQSTQLAYTGLMTAVQIVVTELALGIAGVLRLPALVTANVALAVCVAAAALRARPARNLMRGAVRQAAAALREMAAWENGLLTLLAAFVLLWLTVAAVFLPPRGIDDLDYHLSPLYRTVQTGRIELLPLELRDFFAYPLNGELLFLWPLIFFHDDRFVDVVQLVVALYGTLVVYALARCFEVARRTSFFIGALFLFTPVVLGQAGSAYVDVIAGVFHLVVLLALVRFHRSGDFLHLAVFPLLHQLQDDRIGSAGFVPNISRRCRFSQDEPSPGCRLRRIEDLRGIMGGDLFWCHRCSLTYLSFGITSLPPRKMSRINRSCGTERISSP